jgi:hypothetical protein
MAQKRAISETLAANFRYDRLIGLVFSVSFQLTGASISSAVSHDHHNDINRTPRWTRIFTPYSFVKRDRTLSGAPKRGRARAGRTDIASFFFAWRETW